MLTRMISTGLALTILISGAPAVMAAPAGTQRSAPAIIVPKPISGNVQRGLAYLAGQQLKSGGWNEGEESAYMRASNHANIKDTANIADTCMAALAFVKAGNRPDQGTYAANVARAVEFVCQSIGKADNDSLYVTDVRGTRVQQKLGPYVDTFLASLLLAEVKGHMPDAKGNACVASALDKVIGKIERNQAANGTWGGGGWAPIHSQALASKALNRASQVGTSVKKDVLARAEKVARDNLDTKAGIPLTDAAGVELYAIGANLGAAQDAINTNKLEAERYREIIQNRASKPAEIADARMHLQRYGNIENAQEMALSAVQSKFKDKQFIAGFGCNGGEEFLSYLQISETLVANQSKDFADWDKRVTDNINHVQTANGSWIGQHCITSRTFCTAAAVMVLTADRTPLPSIARAEGQSRSAL